MGSDKLEMQSQSGYRETVHDISSYSANQVVRRLGEDATIWIDPANVSWNATSIRTRTPKNIGILLDGLGMISRFDKGNIYNVFYRNRFIISNNDFNISGKIEELDSYKYISDFIKKIDNYQSTILYKEIAEHIRRNGFFVYKKKIEISTEADIRKFFENYLMGIHDSLRSDGYDVSLAPDVGKCYVSSDGELVKGENARHRLAFAKILGVKSFPLQIFGMHENWYRETIGPGGNLENLRQNIKELEYRHR